MVNANCELLALNLTLLVCVQYLHLHDMSSLNALSQRIQYLNKLNKLLGTLALHECKTSATVKTTNGEKKKLSEILHGIEMEDQMRWKKSYGLDYLADTRARIYLSIIETLQQKKRQKMVISGQ